MTVNNSIQFMIPVVYFQILTKEAKLVHQKPLL